MLLVKKNILEAFEQALVCYCHKLDRGYPIKFYDRVIHSFKLSHKLSLFRENLINCKDDESTLSLVITRFLEKNATFYKHSFNSYFIDELKKSILHIDWDCFRPNAIKLYQGTLFRASIQIPKNVFNHGFQEFISSMSHDNYLKFVNGQIGISTSKNFICAMSYAVQKNKISPSYIYLINYRDEKGYDITATAKARGIKLNTFFHRREDLQEVNIKNSIVKEDILGAWMLTQEGLVWQSNPHYQSARNLKRYNDEVTYQK